MKASSETKLLLILGLIVLLGGGALVGLNLLSDQKAKAPPKQVDMPAPRFNELVKDAPHQEGDPNAAVTVVEFADFQCPSCRRAYQNVLKRMLKDPGRPVHFVFHHFPLESEHQYAVAMGVAAEAAGRQGKFWDMYNALFDRDEKEEVNPEFIKSRAKKIGLDMTKFDKDMQDPALTKLVKDDEALANRSNINYTPTFMVRDQTGKIQSAVGGDELDKLMVKLFHDTPYIKAAGPTPPPPPGMEKPAPTVRQDDEPSLSSPASPAAGNTPAAGTPVASPLPAAGPAARP